MKFNKFNKFTKRIRETVQSYLKNYKGGMSRETTDICMDNFLVDACAQTIGDRLKEQRDNGRGGWWNKNVCATSNLSRMASDNAENGEYLDAAILYLMLYMRVVGGIDKSPSGMYKNGCVTNLQEAVEALNNYSKDPARLAFDMAYRAVPFSQAGNYAEGEGTDKVRFMVDKDVVFVGGFNITYTKDIDVLFDDWVVVPENTEHQEEGNKQ